ncbi:MAG: hypothetical protein HRT44_01300 [Bdellovibrionales bacterium]|nr:hypothetical protein [Bdellovibrionales bacterium]NQZ17884.1 hypothetical protein [Bdellovibrionales bacterium]
MELDHVFVFINPNSPWQKALAKLNLTSNYARSHPGQGTANVCFCFENAFLEILWVESLEETKIEPVSRCQFDKRTFWYQDININPFGIAWRGETKIKTWKYQPPYLSKDQCIHVSEDSGNIHQPFMFSFPGSTPPCNWSAARKNGLQSSGNFTKLIIESITVPRETGASSSLKTLLNSGCFENLILGSEHAMTIRLEQAKEIENRRLLLPNFNFI